MTGLSAVARLHHRVGPGCAFLSPRHFRRVVIQGWFRAGCGLDGIFFGRVRRYRRIGLRRCVSSGPERHFSASADITSCSAAGSASGAAASASDCSPGVSGFGRCRRTRWAPPPTLPRSREPHHQRPLRPNRPVLHGRAWLPCLPWERMRQRQPMPLLSAAASDFRYGLLRCSCSILFRLGRSVVLRSPPWCRRRLRLPLHPPSTAAASSSSLAGAIPSSPSAIVSALAVSSAGPGSAVAAESCSTAGAMPSSLSAIVSALAVSSADPASTVAASSSSPEGVVAVVAFRHRVGYRPCRLQRRLRPWPPHPPGWRA